MEVYKCKMCENVEFSKYNSLSRHMVRIHKVDSDQFYVDTYLGGIWPLCACGCGEPTKWHYPSDSFGKYLRGHISRVKNNWGNNPDVLQKSLDTRRKKFSSGELTTWNSGLTTDDSRVRNNVEKSKITINSNPNELLRRSKLMSKNRSNGTIPTLRGKDHSQWKGGVSEINVLVRSRVRLYNEWKYPILVRDCFKCVECGRSQNLHVHHDKEQMCEIVEKHLVDDIDIMSFELKSEIADKIVDYHIINNVSGVTLCSECHNRVHPSLNFQ